MKIKNKQLFEFAWWNFLLGGICFTLITLLYVHLKGYFNCI